MSVVAFIFKVSDPTRKAQLVQRIKSLGSWISYFDGVFLVDTHYTVDVLHQELVGRITQTDSFLIVGIKPESARGYLPQQAWDWLSTRPPE